MSCSTKIRASEESFNLAQKLITSLAEKYENIVFEEAWGHVCNNTITQLQKRFKKQKKANNPLSSIKKPRTSFSFFTKTQRAKIAEKNPNASFGDLSKLVSKAWKGLSEKELKTYKTMESKDKKRYETEKEKLLKTLATQEQTTPSDSPIAETLVPDPAPTSTSTKTTKSTKSTKTTKSTKSTKSTSKSSSGKKKATKAVGNYNAFQKVKRAELKSQDSSLGLKDINSKLGKMWSGLSDEEKAVFV